MNNVPFKIDLNKIHIGDYVARYCINRLSESTNLEVLLDSIFSTEGIEGDIDWGIHKSDEYCNEDYGIKQYEGWRFYIGPEESPTFKLVECYLSDEEFINLLELAFPKLRIRQYI